MARRPARRSSKHLRPARPLGTTTPTAVQRSDGRWIVRRVPGAQALKAYLCPGCQHPIHVGTPHVVAWRHEPDLPGQSPVAARRHWHTGCWERGR